MPLYENVFIARQDVSASQVDALTDEFTAIVQKRGGQITKKEYWGLRTLQFRIKKNRNCKVLRTLSWKHECPAHDQSPRRKAAQR